MGSPAPSEPLHLRGITKRYHGVAALESVDFDVGPGEIHALVGENGAGKSTLVKIIGGAICPDAGVMRLGARAFRLGSPHEALASGIAVIHQEPHLIPSLTVAENLYAGHIAVHRWFGVPLVDRRAILDGAREILGRLGVRLEPHRLVRSLWAAERQLVEIGKALVHRARFLVMDEPTASLEPAEIKALLELMAKLRASGSGIVLVSHKVDEVLSIADRVTVLRDGRRIASQPVASLDARELVRLIVGGDIADVEPAPAEKPGAEQLSIRVRLGSRPVELGVGRGEIVSVTGLMGGGASDLIAAVGGSLPKVVEAARVNGAAARLHHPAEALARGVGMIPGDRKDGLIPTLSVAENLALSCLDQVSRWGFISRRRMAALGRRFTDGLSIKTPGLWAKVRELSGGNQQKVLLGRLLASGASVLAVDEPTHGVDIRARAEIHRLLAGYAGDGGSILMSSADFPEVLELSDRIVVLRRGEMAGEFSRANATAANLLSCAAGVSSPSRSQDEAGPATPRPEGPVEPAPARRSRVGRVSFFLPLALIALVTALAFLNEHFLTVGNIRNVLLQVSVLAMVSIGMTFVIVAGAFDLSVGSVVALSGSMAALTMVKYGLLLGIAAGVGVGVALGLINGGLIAGLGVSPFIATLGTLVIARGVALAVTGGSVVSDLPESFAALGSGTLWGIPVPVLLALVAFAAGAIVLARTPFGLRVYAVGGNRDAAHLAGIRVGRILVACFAICGTLAALGGLIIAARVQSGQPTVGVFMELYAIAAVVLGGASLRGGEGSMLQTLLGVLLIGFLQNGLNLMNVHSYWQQVVLGLVFIAAAALEWLRRRA
ncbi:MAG: ATP-binding cassette domain-containing protein [Deltaproteobacteria bacterium]|nr:ATP-binding cassette domain-containing protein [Deltaproteobacteria bacterium]